MTGNIIKALAYICMFFDHSYEVFPQVLPCWFRFIGRFAFTAFAFFTAEGCKKTRSIKKYILRLFCAAAVSEAVYDFCFGYSFNFIKDMNVIWTLGFGAALIYIIKEVNGLVFKTVLVLWLFVLCFFCDLDYGFYGVLLVGLFYLCRQKRQIALVTAVLFTVKWGRYILPFGYYTGIWFFSAASFIPIMFYNGKRGSFGGKYYYLIYPVHLLILGVIKNLL